MNGRDDLIKRVIRQVINLNGGKAGVKSIVALAVVGVVVLVGFIAYRLLVFELISNLRR